MDIDARELYDAILTSFEEKKMDKEQALDFLMYLANTIKENTKDECMGRSGSFSFTGTYTAEPEAIQQIKDVFFIPKSKISED